jgi:hypothetical protein
MRNVIRSVPFVSIEVLTCSEKLNILVDINKYPRPATTMTLEE